MARGAGGGKRAGPERKYQDSSREPAASSESWGAGPRHHLVSILPAPSDETRPASERQARWAGLFPKALGSSPQMSAVGDVEK
ncbi:hypothetical protein D4764_05G0003780 [Takifugu flavidus]|uniref:Uncharacterized protein n=1 Tax=Takifugu flavidus TaxID=433684 RepID=A0A5C6N0Q2_9TELE|nr:hypothetical protein D4764_05G0003780 [Takifugu flavidus]